MGQSRILHALKCYAVVKSLLERKAVWINIIIENVTSVLATLFLMVASLIQE